MDKIIKIVLAILFFLCLADMPYGFYQFVRFASLIGFTYLSYDSYMKNKHKIAVGWVDVQDKYGASFRFLFLAILFQPFFKIALGREMWNIVDVVVGIGLIISIFMKPKRIYP